MLRTTLLLGLAVLPVFSAEVRASRTAPNIQTYTMKSDSLAADRKVNVLLPVDYDKSTLRYPVLYLLHGLGDDQSAWSYMTNLSGYAAKHKVIVVMPDGGTSFYINSVGDPQAKFEDMVAKDLMSWTDQTFRTIPLRRARAIAGLSMGGYGAMMLGLKHANRYAAIGAFSGALGFARWKQLPGNNAAARSRAEEWLKMLGPADGPERATRDPYVFAEKGGWAQAPMIYIACGGQDFLVADNRSFVQLLAEKKIAYEYREVSQRGHTWDFWDDNIRIFLGMLAGLDGWKVD